MKKYIKSVALLLIAGFLGTSLTRCTKQHDNTPKTPELPPITHEGKNTFGCIVDGEIFAIPFETHRIQCEYYFNKSKANYGNFQLFTNSGITSKLKSFGYQIYHSVLDTGYYKMDEKLATNGNLERRTVTFKYDRGKFHCTEEMFGSIHITYIDTINKIISGTFEFDAVNENNNTDTIRVRDGRFDCGKFIY